MDRKIISKEQLFFFLANKIPFPYINPLRTSYGIAQGIMNFLIPENRLIESRLVKYKKFSKFLNQSVPGSGTIVCVKIDTDFRSGTITENISQRYVETDIPYYAGRNEKVSIKYHKTPTFYYKIFVVKPNQNTWEHLKIIFPNFKF